MDNSDCFWIDTDGDIIPIERTATPATAKSIAPIVITKKDIEAVRKSTAKGPRKFAYIKNTSRKLHVAAAVIDSLEAKLSRADSVIAYLESSSVPAREAQELADENKKLVKRVDHFRKRIEADEEKYACLKNSLEDAITNYEILRETYDRLRAQHPLPAERPLPRRPQRQRDDDEPAAKKPKL